MKTKIKIAACVLAAAVIAALSMTLSSINKVVANYDTAIKAINTNIDNRSTVYVDLANYVLTSDDITKDVSTKILEATDASATDKVNVYKHTDDQVVKGYLLNVKQSIAMSESMQKSVSASTISDEQKSLINSAIVKIRTYDLGLRANVNNFKKASKTKNQLLSKPVIKQLSKLYGYKSN